jgi:hypothetical protein
MFTFSETTMLYQRILGVILLVSASVGFICDVVMVKLYVASIQRFFCLFNVDALPWKHRVAKLVFYYTMVPFFIVRMALEMFSIIAWNFVVFGDLSEHECWNYTNTWIGVYLKILGYVNDFIPNYAAIIILYILSLFGSKTSMMESSARTSSLEDSSQDTKRIRTAGHSTLIPSGTIVDRISFGAKSTKEGGPTKSL